MARNIHPSPGGASSPDPKGSVEDFAHVNTIVMDLDDTIVSGTPPLLAYIETLYEGLSRETRLSMAEIAKGFAEIRLNEIYAFTKALNQHGPLREKYPHGDLNERFAHIGERANKAFVDALQPDPDFVAAIERWHAQGYRLILMTEGPGSATTTKIDPLPFADALEKVGVVDETSPVPGQTLAQLYPSKLWDLIVPLPAGFKEDSQVVKAGLDAMGVDPKTTVMIGNRTDRDLKPMHELGAKTILVNHFNRRPNEAALKRQIEKYLFGGKEMPKGAGAATTEDAGGVTPDATLERTARLTELLAGPPGYVPKTGGASPRPDVPRPGPKN
ncbi:MAG: HAD family hydrolase [Pseudomonadota bacterium]